MDIGGVAHPHGERPRGAPGRRRASSTSTWSAPASSATRSCSVAAPVARRLSLVDAGGAPLADLEVPGATTMKFGADGPHIVLGDLTAPADAGRDDHRDATVSRSRAESGSLRWSSSAPARLRAGVVRIFHRPQGHAAFTARSLHGVNGVERHLVRPVGDRHLGTACRADRRSHATPAHERRSLPLDGSS